MRWVFFEPTFARQNVKILFGKPITEDTVFTPAEFKELIMKTRKKDSAFEYLGSIYEVEMSRKMSFEPQTLDWWLHDTENLERTQEDTIRTGYNRHKSFQFYFHDGALHDKNTGKRYPVCDTLKHPITYPVVSNGLLFDIAKDKNGKTHIKQVISTQITSIAAFNGWQIVAKLYSRKVRLNASLEMLTPDDLKNIMPSSYKFNQYNTVEKYDSTLMLDVNGLIDDTGKVIWHSHYLQYYQKPMLRKL
jgi:hypothetical protein